MGSSLSGGGGGGGKYDEGSSLMEAAAAAIKIREAAKVEAAATVAGMMRAVA